MQRLIAVELLKTTICLFLFFTSRQKQPREVGETVYRGGRPVMAVHEAVFAVEVIVLRELERGKEKDS